MKIEKNNKDVDILFWELYALMLDKNTRDNIEGYERILKKHLGEGWVDVSELWNKFINNKIKYVELLDTMYQKEDYKVTSFHEFSQAFRKAQGVFIEGEKEDL